MIRNGGNWICHTIGVSKANSASRIPRGTGGGALSGRLGWCRKTFTVPATAKGKLIFIEFDGMYRNSEV